MRVLVSGSTGLIGSALAVALAQRGYELVRLVRRTPLPGEAAIAWDPAAGTIDAARLEGLDAVVHLAGEPIGALRWTRRKRARIRESRVAGTRLLVETLAGQGRPPAAFLCASAIGYYGSRGDGPLHEESGPGDGFLASLTQAWEQEAARAASAGMREARLRFGMVLAPSGGALRAMLRAFRLGLGGRLGSGRQWVSWIALDDAVGAILHVLESPRLAGPVNVVAPGTVTNGELTRTLAQVLGRPALLRAPAWALRWALGAAADETLLSSARAEPAKLLGSGYAFRYPELEPALRAMLGRPGSRR